VKAGVEERRVNEIGADVTGHGRRGSHLDQGFAVASPSSGHALEGLPEIHAEPLQLLVERRDVGLARQRPRDRREAEAGALRIAVA
jgi:hypothetical protein